MIAIVLQSAMVELLLRMSGLQPLLLVADDVHWSDDETLQLLRRLARVAPEGRVLVVVAFRHRGEELGRGAREHDRRPLSPRGRVSRHTRQSQRPEVSAFIRGSSEEEPSPELASALGELTNGTPLLLCELWRDLVESGALGVSRARVQLTRPVSDLRGPERIHDIVRQRLSRLSPEANELLELAAVGGPRSELRVLAEAAGLGQGALVAAVDEAVRNGMIEELPELASLCRFTHELVRRSIYDRIERIRRTELHLRVAEALEHVHAADLGRVLPELAHHFTLAIPLASIDRAVDYNLRAASAAVASLAFGEGAARLTTALELGIPDPRLRVRVQVELGYLLNETGRFSESDAILAASLDVATGLEERGVAARALVQRSHQRVMLDPGFDPEAMLPVAENAIETFRQLDDLSASRSANGCSP